MKIKLISAAVVAAFALGAGATTAMAADYDYNGGEDQAQPAEQKVEIDKAATKKVWHRVTERKNRLHDLDEGAYLLGGIGANFTDTDLYDRLHPTFTFKLGGGYKFNPYFSIEGAYYYLGNVSRTVNFQDKSSVKAEISGHMLGVAPVVYLPLTRKFSLFGKVGVGYTRVKAEGSSQYQGITIDKASQSKSRVVPFVGLGYEYWMSPSWSFRTEYEGIFGASKNTADTGEVNYHLLTLGLRYRFW